MAVTTDLAGGDNGSRKNTRRRPAARAHRPVPSIAPIVPDVLEVRVPGRDYDIDLAGERWRCPVIRTDPPLFVLTKGGSEVPATVEAGP